MFSLLCLSYATNNKLPIFAGINEAHFKGNREVNSITTQNHCVIDVVSAEDPSKDTITAREMFTPEVPLVTQSEITDDYIPLEPYGYSSAG